jgi:hypothetical protein
VRAPGVVTVPASAPRRHGGAVDATLPAGLEVATAVALAPMEQGGAPGKVVGGGAHPNGGAAWRRWRTLGTAVFSGDDGAPVIGGGRLELLQHRGRKARVRRGSIQKGGGCVARLTDDG